MPRGAPTYTTWGSIQASPCGQGLHRTGTGLRNIIIVLCGFTFAHGVEELLGVLVGYLSGPLHPETQEERAQREASSVLIEE